MKERPLPSGGRTDHEVPAASIQRFFWDLQVGNWSNTNIPLAWRLRGPLDRAALKRSIDALVRRHEALRTSLAERDGKLMQLIWPVAPILLTTISIPAVDSLDEGRAEEVIATELGRPFDLAERTLCRFILFEAGGDEEDHLLAVAVNHAICDLDSCVVLFHELIGLLKHEMEGTPDLPPVDTQFRDYSTWESDDRRDRHAEFWRRATAPTTSVLPRAEDVHSPSEFIWIQCDSPAFRADALEGLAAECRTTLASVILAAVAAAFSPWTRDALRIGATYSNRGSREFREVVGPTISLLPLRISLRAEMSLRTVIEETRRAWIDALAHAVPLYRLMAHTGAVGYWDTHLFDLTVNYFPKVVFDGTGCRSKDGELAISHYVLGKAPRERSCADAVGSFPCEVVGYRNSSGGLQFACDADPRVLPPDALRMVCAYIGETVAMLARNPDASLGRVCAAHRDLLVLGSLGSR